MASLASSRPAVDEPRRCREEQAVDGTDAEDVETSSGRRSRMTTVTSIDDNEDRLDTSSSLAVELEMDSRQCTLVRQGSQFVIVVINTDDSVPSLKIFNVFVLDSGYDHQ